MKGMYLDPKFIRERISPNWDTYLWFMDGYQEFLRCNSKPVLEACKYKSTTSISLASIVNGKVIFEGIDTDTWKKEKLPIKYDVSFVGSLDKKRHEYFDNSKVTVFESSMYAYSYVDCNKIYNQSKMVVNLVRDPFIVSNRVLCTLATNAIMISEESYAFKYIDSKFNWKPFIFKTKDEMDGVIDNILSNYEYYKKLQQEAKLDNGYSWEDQLTKVLNYVVEY